jgi:hypothetical protein
MVDWVGDSGSDSDIHYAAVGIATRDDRGTGTRSCPGAACRGTEIDLQWCECLRRDSDIFRNREGGVARR